MLCNWKHKARWGKGTLGKGGGAGRTWGGAGWPGVREVRCRMGNGAVGEECVEFEVCTRNEI